MAVIPPLSSGAGRAVSPGGSDAAAQARAAAQRAFFQAALNQAQASAPVTKAAVQPSPPAVAVTQVKISSDGAAPDRIARPGSLLNIVV